MVGTKTDSTSNPEEVDKKEQYNRKWNMDKTLLRTFAVITCIKALLIPCYYSTDFEVHRNWLAITYSLPIREWYINAKSQWTLDYPPLFAWFEYALSQVARLFDEEMLKVDNFNYASPTTIYFQRTTVMVSDLMFAYGIRELGEVFYKSYNSYCVFIFLSLCNIGLLIVDHIHFQYNGFLLGFLLLSIANVSRIWNQASILQGAACFAILLNLKHIYLYVAPAFIVWLLKSYCMKNGQFIKRIFILAAIVTTILTLTFGPFIYQLPQIISRLFPFKRGLVHAYWAANGWALYVTADKILSVIWRYLGWIKIIKSAVMTGGLVQEEIFLVLPSPKPIFTFMLTFVGMLPALYILLCRKGAVTPINFVRCLVLCALTSFIFGWHVHEKAILTAIIPLCVLATVDNNDARIYIILSSAGHTSLLPLLYPNNLTPLNILLLLLHILSINLILRYLFKKSLLYLHEFLYVSLLPLVAAYESILHKFFFGDNLPFLPLALISIYCAIGIIYSWLFYYYYFIYVHENNKKRRTKKE
ncbi:probable dolichyl pyrophosphate Glc1Man9GlcNAc2 alpha-1,3-glucosyltransferase isoform X1 [Polistes fuscatus]|uniref:probable dolichyl pyrophosphate Glc1Man9GlcNAc2 alpha-1,3-glucosyltransferase isoform X1 n=2 Tax=Polistes fuscatus TaxID=30207 RepID=UPI001CA9C7B2|nr:probable dolichyl pyrophosphate Glc1Man9GlcNAc2 alpha-1,3-glucosyltransferase isoform X1 [Polistes fuscatus]